MLLFSNLNKIFFGYFDAENIFKITKTINYRGDLTDVSAKKEAPSVTSSLLLRIPEHPHLGCYCSVACFKTTMTDAMCLNVEREYGTLSSCLLLVQYYLVVPEPVKPDPR